MALPNQFFDDDTGTSLPQQQYGDSEQSGPPGPPGPVGPPGSGGVLAIDTVVNGLVTGNAVYQVLGAPSRGGKAKSDGGTEPATFLGFYDGTPGEIIIEGDLANEVLCTTAGGLPAIGQLLYLAAGADDGGTGAGKVTATPTIALGYFYAPVAVCLDNTSYAGSKKVKAAILKYPPIKIWAGGSLVPGGGGS